MTKNKAAEEYVATQAFSIKLSHIGMLADLATRWGWKRSAIVQAAIEEYYARHNPEAPEEIPNDRNS